MSRTAIALSLALGTLASEDLAAIAGAILAADGTINVWSAILAVTAGIYAGDLLLFAAGRVAVQHSGLRNWLLRRCGNATKMTADLDDRLALAIVTSRFVPGSRLPVYVAAGLFSRRPLAFCLWTLLAVTVWTPFLMGGVLLLGHAFESAARTYLQWTPAIGFLLATQYLARRFLSGASQ